MFDHKVDVRPAARTTATSTRRRIASGSLKQPVMIGNCQLLTTNGPINPPHRLSKQHCKSESALLESRFNVVDKGHSIPSAKIGLT
eukprot:m.465388 g.465388  ORF g.465388 m.465388 type:complete len:86 (-) comp24198_c0_seq1:1661-1918(-)